MWHRLTLTGSLDLRAAPELAASLLARFGEGEGIAIETQALESIDVGILQLLLSARKHAAEAGLEIGLADPIGVAFSDEVALLGLSDPIGPCAEAERLFLTQPIPSEAREEA